MKFFLTLIGLIFILEGLPYAAAPETMRRWLRQVLTMGTGQMRLIGFLSMAIGFFLCYLTLRSGIFPP